MDRPVGDGWALHPPGREAVDTFVGGRGSASALGVEWQTAPERGEEELTFSGKSRHPEWVGVAWGVREACGGPGRALEAKRMLSLCCGPQVHPGLMVSVLRLPHREFQMQCSDPAEPGSQWTHLLWS